MSAAISDSNVSERFRRAAARWPDRAFLNVLPETADAYGIAAGEITYARALDIVEALAAQYRAAGYGAGHRVGLLLQNRPDFIWHFLALNTCGASIVPINPDLRAAELSYLAEHSEMILAVAVHDRVADLQAAAPELSVLTAESAPLELPMAPPRGETTASGPDAECALLYTSGTTGRPKGCILSNFYFLNTGDWYASVGGALTIHEDPPERMLTPLPLFHVNALVFSMMTMITVGGCLSVLDRFHPKTWWDSVKAADASIIHYLGIMPPLLMKQPDRTADRDHCVRFGFGAGIDPALHVAAEERFGFPFVEGWAMSETGAGGVIMASDDPRDPGTANFGRPRNGVEARIVLDDGAEAAIDEPGELLVRRAGGDPRRGFFSGYLKNPQATAEAWAGGWLNTGDIVLRDANGNFRFVDRKKNIVRRSGENISAAEVESILLQRDDIRNLAVAPAPDDVRGEEVMALIIADGARDAGHAAAITHWALDQMAYYKAPGWIAFIDSLPVTATEKIQRGEIRTLVSDLLTRGAAHDTRALKKRA
ncbi:MAG: AMP-binding protein [Pseudomonadota bacterium]